MKVCVFEWINGGGSLFERISLTSPDKGFLSLLTQGQRMMSAVAEDFLQAGHEVTLLQDIRLDTSKLSSKLPSLSVALVDCPENLAGTLVEVAAKSDAILLIAPETNGCLEMVCGWLAEFYDRLISPDWDFIRLTSDKHRTCQYLSNRKIPVPRGCLLSQLAQFQRSTELRRPWVIKPVDGAGSERLKIIECDFENELISEPGDVSRIRSNAEFDKAGCDGQQFRVEEFASGTAASVSVLCRGRSFELLPATRQIFDAVPVGHYLAAAPLEASLANRASELANRTVRALPLTRGYIGIDMVLSDQFPENDLVVEVNPRLTMSYLWLRQLCNFNIAERMLIPVEQ